LFGKLRALRGSVRKKQRRRPIRNIVRNLIDFGFNGRMFLFGRRPDHLFGHPILTRWEDVPYGVDLAAVLVPAGHVPATLAALAERGITRAVVATGGFEELGPERRALQEQLVAIARETGMRFVGPNGLGVINTRTGLCTAFMPLTPPPRRGGVHVLAQSGGVGVYYLSRLAEEGLPLGVFVSMGNKLDVDECDLLEYLATTDPQLVSLYLEDIRDGRRFFDIARRYPCPLIVHKANTSAAGAKAAQSHTASIAADNKVVDAALRQAGAVRTRDSERAVNDAKAFSLPPMRGDRMLIVSRSGGHAVIAADLTESFEFALPPLPAETAARVQARLRAGVIRLRNPLDLGDLFDFDVYVQILEDGLRMPEFDGVVFVHVFDAGPEARAARRFVDLTGELSTRYDKPVYLCLMSSASELAELRRRSKIPFFTTPEDALRAAYVSRTYHTRASLPEAPVLDGPALDDPGTIGNVIAAARRDGRRLLAADALTLAAAAGFRTAPHAVAHRIDEVAHHAAVVGFPLVMKILSENIPHKSDIGGVMLGINDGKEAERAFETILQAARDGAPDAQIDGVLLQRMEPGLREVFLGGKRDPNFGPVVMVGLGGIAVELFQDVSLRLAPLTERDIDDMLSEVVSFRALSGVRTLPAADVDFLREAIARMARLLLDVPEIQEIDLNPLKLHRAGQGGCVVDARVLLSEEAPEA
jgi:acetate---CoA ligase (ADP-forming)